MTHQQIIVSDMYNGMRLDKFLRMQLKDYHWSQSFIEKALRDKKIKIDDRKSASSDRLSTGMIVDIKQVPSSYVVQKDKYLHNEAKDLKKYILFEDDHIIALNKPCGLACQGGTKIAVSLDDILKCIDPEIRLVHRLDKKTSGLLVVAKNLKVAQKLTGYFKTHDIHKTYIAIVHGKPRPAKGVIDSPIMIGREEKSAHTSYSMMSSNHTYSRVRLNPSTGRQHQLRVHMASLGCPIVGDDAYGEAKNSAKLMLHSFSMQLPPLGEGENEPLMLSCPIPSYFDKYI